MVLSWSIFYLNLLCLFQGLPERPPQYFSIKFSPAFFYDAGISHVSTSIFCSGLFWYKIFVESLLINVHSLFYLHFYISLFVGTLSFLLYSNLGPATPPTKSFMLMAVKLIPMVTAVWKFVSSLVNELLILVKNEENFEIVLNSICYLR